MLDIRDGLNVWTRRSAILGSAVMAFVTFVGLPAAQVAPYDLLLRNARIVDGTGSPWYRGDLAIRGDRSK